MKKVIVLTILILLSLLLIRRTAQGQITLTGFQQAQNPGRLPKYLMITRQEYLSGVTFNGLSYQTTEYYPLKSTEKEKTNEKVAIEYSYEYIGFDSKEEALTYLEGFIYENDVVGLWELGNSKPIPIKLNVTHHKKEEKIKVEVKEWDEYKWEIKD